MQFSKKKNYNFELKNYNNNNLNETISNIDLIEDKFGNLFRSILEDDSSSVSLDFDASIHKAPQPLLTEFINFTRGGYSKKRKNIINKQILQA
jgi:hypothetical protein